MNTKIGKAERFGRVLGRMWRGYISSERRVAIWLVAQGSPVAGAATVLWIVKLIALGLVLYTSFWLFLLLVFATATTWLARNESTDEENRLEWREGHSGFGLYDKNEWRHDMGDSDES